MRRSGQVSRGDLKSAGEIEAAVGRAVVEFLQETYGRGARETTVHPSAADVVVLNLRVLPEPQQRIVADHSATECACLLKQYRARVLTVTLERIRELILGATGFRPKVVLHDFLPESGEEMFVFHLDGIPSVRT